MTAFCNVSDFVLHILFHFSLQCLHIRVDILVYLSLRDENLSLLYLYSQTWSLKQQLFLLSLLLYLCDDLLLRVLKPSYCRFVHPDSCLSYYKCYFDSSQENP